VEARIVTLERELERLRCEPAAQDSQMYVDSIKFVCFLYYLPYSENVSSTCYSTETIICELDTQTINFF